MAYTYTEHDGGRSSSKRPKQRRDCVIRAISIAHEIPYDHVYDTMKELGRKSGRSTLNKLWKPWVSSRAMEYRSFPPEKGRKRMNVRDFCGIYNTGRWIISMAGHLSTVIDGVIHDTDPINPEGCVYCAWKC